MLNNDRANGELVINNTDSKLAAGTSRLVLPNCMIPPPLLHFFGALMGNTIAG